MAGEDKIFQEIDLYQVLKEIGTKNKVLQARMLQELEKYVPPHSEEFSRLRKFVLDEQNSYTRSIVRLIFGDIEFMNFSRH